MVLIVNAAIPTPAAKASFFRLILSSLLVSPVSRKAPPAGIRSGGELYSFVRFWLAPPAHRGSDPPVNHPALPGLAEFTILCDRRGVQPPIAVKAKQTGQRIETGKGEAPMGHPFFSVVIPVYNRAALLRAAIASVRAQSFQDFEIIVIDDGSTDTPQPVAESFADARIRFVRQDNAGGGAARNTGIDLARGRFIAFLDSDDVFLPHHLAAMHALLKGTEGLAGYARVWVDRGHGPAFLKPPRAVRPAEEMACYLLCDRGFTPTSTMVVPTGGAQLIRFNEHLRAAEDTDFAIRLVRAGWRFRMLEEPGAIWSDTDDPARLSADQGIEQLARWLDALRPILPPKAWHGARGWPYAKRVARKNPLAALGLYLNAVLRGCYRPSLAGVIFLQIFLGFAGYRQLANRLVGLLPVGWKKPRRLSANLTPAE
jgi:glycosyltransferase involved in cell wall biosynthesis